MLLLNRTSWITASKNMWKYFLCSNIYSQSCDVPHHIVVLCRTPADRCILKFTTNHKMQQQIQIGFFFIHSQTSLQSSPFSSLMGILVCYFLWCFLKIINLHRGAQEFKQEQMYVLSYFYRSLTPALQISWSDHESRTIDLYFCMIRAYVTLQANISFLRSP